MLAKHPSGRPASAHEAWGAFEEVVMALLGHG
jgi:hypothetical protein